MNGNSVIVIEEKCHSWTKNEGKLIMFYIKTGSLMSAISILLYLNQALSLKRFMYVTDAHIQDSLGVWIIFVCVWLSMNDLTESGFNL